MDYKTLYESVKAELQHDMTFAIEVKTWCHEGREPETEWGIYVAAWKEHFAGPSAQAVFEAFKVSYADRETIEETSAAVGNAEVDA